MLYYNHQLVDQYEKSLGETFIMHTWIENDCRVIFAIKNLGSCFALTRENDATACLKVSKCVTCKVLAKASNNKSKVNKTKKITRTGYNRTRRALETKVIVPAAVLCRPKQEKAEIQDYKNKGTGINTT